MKTVFFAALAIFAATPAAAQTIPLVIQNGTGDRITVTATVSLQERIEIAAEDACAKPFLRDLKGQELYAECLTEARAQVEAIFAERALAGAELAAR